MKHITLPAFAAAIVLAVCPAAFAAGNTAATGVTSGPAAGTPTVPNTAVPKQNWSTNSAGATGAGAPGTPAKQGTEAGAAPHKTMSPKTNTQG
ncbi:MAG: hypothetical protein JO122_09835 [Acetobacteraceae bacterium]|nr:hypothetical protein [Acetobacteraceae bacterium]